MDEQLRRLTRKLSTGEISQEEVISALYRSGRNEEADQMLLDMWDELQLQGRNTYETIINTPFYLRVVEMGIPNSGLFQKLMSWLSGVVEFFNRFPPKCSCQTCQMQCGCMLTGKCDLSWRTLDDEHGCPTCETLMPRLGSNCNTPRIEPGNFAVKLQLRTINEGSSVEFTIPRLVCEDSHWIPPYHDEDGTQMGGYNDVEHLSLWPGDYARTAQMPAEIERWVIKHAFCRLPPEEDYDWSSDEEQWRTAIEEEQAGFGGGLPFYG